MKRPYLAFIALYAEQTNFINALALESRCAHRYGSTGIFGLAMLAYLPYVFWETFQVNALCEEIKPGLEVKELPEIC